VSFFLPVFSLLSAFFKKSNNLIVFTFAPLAEHDSSFVFHFVRTLIHLMENTGIIPVIL
jgi:hypothetical protein